MRARIHEFMRLIVLDAVQSDYSEHGSECVSYGFFVCVLCRHPFLTAVTAATELTRPPGH